MYDIIEIIWYSKKLWYTKIDMNARTYSIQRNTRIRDELAQNPKKYKWENGMLILAKQHNILPLVLFTLFSNEVDNPWWNKPE